MNGKREQWLFLVVLAATALLAWSRYADRYVSRPIPRSKRLSDAEPVSVPSIVFPSPDDPVYRRDGRDVFLPPRDWTPLPPLALERPPLPEIGLVDYVPAPGVEPWAQQRLWRRYAPPPAMDEEEVAAAGEENGGEQPSAPEGIGDSRFAGVLSAAPTGDDVDLVASERTQPERVWDWIQRRGMPRLYGRILADDPFELLDDPEAPIRFQTVDLRTGKPLGVSEIPRSELEGDGRFGVGFGFADTVANRVRLLERETPTGPASVRSQLAAARRCLEWVEDDREAALAGAERFVRRVLEISPKEPEAWELRVEIARASLDLEEEAKALEEAERLGIRSAALAAARGSFFLRLGLPDEATAVLEKARREYPNSAGILLLLGRAAVEAGRAKEALEWLKAAEQRASSVADRLEARIEAARASYRIGDFDAAQEAARRALRIAADDPRALTILGAVALAREDVPGARSALLRALEADPAARDAVYDLAVADALEAEERPDTAEQARARFERAADLDPLTWFWSAAGEGALDERLGDLDRARARFEEALGYEPGRPFGLYRLGRSARRLGDVDGARERLLEALAREGRMAPVLDELGYVELLSDRPRRAEIYLEESVRLWPEGFEARRLLGHALLRAQRLEEAREACADFLADRERPDAPTLCALAFLDYRLGRVDQAIREFAEARAAAGPGEDLFADYATRSQEGIEDNRAKEQWVDRFERRAIKNGWLVREAHGPTARATGEALEIVGLQRRTDSNEPTEVVRTVDGARFVLVEGDLVSEEGNEAALGLCFRYERVSGRRTIPYGEVAAARFPDGSLRLYVRDDKNTVQREWEPIEGVRIEAGAPFTLTIERTDYEAGTFRVLLDGSVVADGIASKALRKLKHECLTGVFAFAEGNRNVRVRCDRVRIVRYRE